MPLYQIKIPTLSVFFPPEFSFYLIDVYFYQYQTIFNYHCILILGGLDSSYS